jgi:hypothetical protein
MGYSRLSGDTARGTNREESPVTLTRLTRFTKNMTRVSRHIGLLELAGITETATRSRESPVRLTRLAIQSRKQEVLVRLLIQKAGL